MPDRRARCGPTKLLEPCGFVRLVSSANLGGMPMPLGLNEIKDRALRFSREWADESSEDAEAQAFLYNELIENSKRSP